MTRYLIYPARFEPIQAPANPIAPTQWFAPLSEPRKIVIAAAVLVASGAVLPPQPAQAAVTIPQGWYSPLSEPARVRGVLQTDGVLPLAPPATITLGWLGPLSEPIRILRQSQTTYDLAPQPPTIAIIVPQGWYSPLSQPLFQPQTARTAPAQVVSQVFAFAPPAAAVAPPAMAFYSPLSEPYFKRVQYATTLIQHPSWGLVPPIIPSPWTPVIPGTSIWSPQSPNSSIWTPQVPGAPIWTPQ